MSEFNIPYNVNGYGMKQCCMMTVKLEVYRRHDEGEPIHEDGATVNCITCGAQLICDMGTQSLRWRWKGDANV